MDEFHTNPTDYIGNSVFSSCGASGFNYYNSNQLQAFSYDLALPKIVTDTNSYLEKTAGSRNLLNWRKKGVEIARETRDNLANAHKEDLPMLREFTRKQRSEH